MTRISGLLLATGLAILPIAAFAQQTATPAATPTEQAATPAAQPTKTTAAKTHVATKQTRSIRAKRTTTTPAAKPAVPSNS